MSGEGVGQSLSSVRVTYINPGDVIYIPFGSLLCEKALGGHSLGLRIPMALLSPTQRPAAMFLEKKSPLNPTTPIPGCSSFKQYVLYFFSVLRG